MSGGDQVTTPKQDMKRLKIIETCHNHIRAKGANRNVTIMMPCTQAWLTRRRFSAKGPYGMTITQTHDGKKALVMFAADKLLTSLEVIRRSVQNNIT